MAISTASIYLIAITPRMSITLEPVFIEINGVEVVLDNENLDKQNNVTLVWTGIQRR